MRESQRGLRPAILPGLAPPSRVPFIAALCVLLAAPVLIGAGFWGFSYDDAFITYRYARHWADGHGLVYNLGEAVLGTTAPGWALLLGLLSRLSGLAVPGWGTALSLAALTLTLVLLAAAAGRGGLRAPSWAFLAALAGASAVALRWNVELLGAETFPVLGLVTAAAFLACERDRPTAAGLLAAAAMACRLDAGLAAAALGLVLWVARRRFPWRFAAAGLAPLALWLAWLQARFGAVIPNTLAGKQSELPFATHGYTLAEWLWLRRTLPLSGAAVLLVLAAVGLFAGWRLGFWRRPFFAALGFWLFLHELAYRLIGVPFAPWYQVPLVAVLTWLAVLGALSAATLVPSTRAGTAIGNALSLGCALVLLLPVITPSVRYLAGQWGRPPDPRTRVYAAVGREVERRPAEAVAAVEIGVLGWTAERARILDLGGLVSPQVLAAKASGTLPGLVVVEHPACLVDAPVFRAMVLGAVLAEPAVAAAYRPVAAVRAPEYGGGTVRLLCRAPE